MSPLPVQARNDVPARRSDDALAPPDKRRAALTRYLQALAAQVLRQPLAQIDPQRPLGAFGVDSLAAVELAHAIEADLGVVLPLTSFLQDCSIAQLAANIYDQEAAGDVSSLRPESPSAAITTAPLSYGQRSLWLLYQLAPQSAAYNIAQAVRIDTELDVAALRRAFQALTDRHALLRATFTARHGEPFQRLHERVPVWFEQVDAATWSDAALQQRLAEEARRPCDLERGPVFRVQLFQRSAREHVLLLVMHHIVTDFWSLTVLVQELDALYTSERAGTQPVLPPLDAQYTDYVAWQSALLAGPQGEQLWTYWRVQLAGRLPVLALPTDRARPAVQTDHGSAHAFTLDAQLSQALAAVAQAHGATLYMTLLAAFQILLYRYTAQTDLVLGSPLAGRSSARFANVVGYFMNPVVLRSDLSGTPSFIGLLDRVRRTVLGALAHQDYPAHLLVERLQLNRNRSYSALFQVMFILNRPHRLAAQSGSLFVMGQPDAAADLGGLRMTPLAIAQQAAQLDLTLMMVEVAGSLSGALQYNTDLFDATTIARLLGHFRMILTGLVADPNQSIDDLALLSAAERQQLLEWNGVQRNAVGHSCIHTLIAAQAARTPDACAVFADGAHLSYRELNRRANQLARHLQRIGVGPEVRMGLCMERSLELIIGLLGVHKAGGAYVPLDPSYPTERLAFMLQDSRAPVLITTTEATRGWGLGVGGQTDDVPAPDPRSPIPDPWTLVDLHADWPIIAQADDANPPDRATSRNLAYIIYTSGSTGRPKGAMIPHEALVRYSATATNAYALQPDDRVLQFASICFDTSAEEIYPCLSRGATLVLRTDAMLGSAATFLTRCGDWGVSVLDLPTAYWHELTMELARAAVALPAMVRLVIIGGERALPERLAQWRQSVDASVRLVNTYGPTETTIVAVMGDVATGGARATVGEVPLGRVIDHVQAYVLDRSLQPVPIGVVGHLHIAGAGLARGYLGRSDLTAEKFIPNPFASGGDKETRRQGAKEPRSTAADRRQSTICNLQSAIGTRLYRTGDLARFRADGTLEFVGRVDDQVKIRGFRVELGEVAAALARHPQLREVAVLARANESQDTRLVAYVVQESGIRDQGSGEALQEPPIPDPRSLIPELRAFLSERLPNYMLPSAYVLLDALPRTPSGKLDSGALPAPQDGLAAASYVAPRNPLEEVVAGIWAEVLGIERIGVTDNFFELGGHSLLAMQIIARLRDVVQYEPALASFFEQPTVAALAEQIAKATPSASAGEVAPIQPVPRDQPIPLSFPQEHIWFLNQLDPDSASYHVPRAVKFSGRLAVRLLERTFSELVRRHEMLRTTFPLIAGRPMQAIHPPWPVRIPVVDLCGLAEAVRAAEVQRWIVAEGRRSFDIVHGPLLRLVLLRLAEEAHVLIMTEYHLIHDGWSQGVLMQEFIAIYSAFADQRPSPLPELRIQFADFAYWQRAWMQGDVLETELAYWKQTLAGVPELLDLPLDNPRPDTRSFQGAEEVFVLAADQAEALRALSRRAGCTLFMTMLAVFKVLLYRYSGQEDIVVGSVVANRRWREIERMLGMVINTLVLRTDLAGNPSFRTLLQRVRTTCLAAYAHQDVPFEKIVEALQPARSLSYNPLFQVMFGFQDTQTPEMELPGLVLELLDSHNRSAKFDLDVTVLPLAEQLTGLRAASDASEIVVHLEYNTDIFNSDTITQMRRHFQSLLLNVVADPERHISDLPLLSAAERQQLLVAWNDTQADYPQVCIPDLFEAQVERTPDAVAVIAEDQHLTYRALSRRTNQLAQYLRARGVGPEALVGLLVERSLDMAVGLLGILKAGGAYLPLDSSYPAERLAFMLQDSRARVLVTADDNVGARYIVPLQTMTDDKERSGLLVSVSPCLETVVDLHADWPLIAQERDTPVGGGAMAGNLAYVIYTSGSTGSPKGVQITHRAMVNHNLAIARHYQLHGSDRALHAASISFDFAVEELFPPWLHGAAVVLVPEGLLVSVPQFMRWVDQMQLTVMLLPTAYWHEWVRQVALAEQPLPVALRLVAIGGERALPERLRLWQALPRAHTTWINTYGPTEATVSAILYAPGERITRWAEVPIGRPIANTQVYVLDRFLQLVPIGMPGELYLAGHGLARGYLNRPDLTAERFVPNPFAEVSGTGYRVLGAEASDTRYPAPDTRLYATGDRVRYLVSGDIEYLGRIDGQIKLRGFRIEPAEIEAVLRSHAAVRECVVLVQAAAPSASEYAEQRLVAYVVPMDDDRRGTIYRAPTADDEADPSIVHRSSSIVTELRAFLATRLPDYMLPASFVVLDALPKTPNGKLDRRALPLPDGTRPDVGPAYVAPRTPVEEQLARAWAEVLGIERVGIYDNFFTLGGHSLLATQLNNKLREIFQVELLLRRIFEAPCVADLAAIIVHMQADQADEDELAALLSQVEQLSDDAARALLAD